MARVAPRVDPVLSAGLARIDDPDLSIGEINRRLGKLAEQLDLPRPSYEQVRRMVHALRAGKRPSRTGEVLLEIAFRARPPDALLGHLAGTNPI